MGKDVSEGNKNKGMEIYVFIKIYCSARTKKFGNTDIKVRES